MYVIFSCFITDFSIENSADHAALEHFLRLVSKYLTEVNSGNTTILIILLSKILE